MMEELALIRLEIQQHAYKITRMMSYGGPPTIMMQNCLDKIKEFKELAIKNEREIARVKYVLFVGLVFVATCSSRRFNIVRSTSMYSKLMLLKIF